MGNFGQIEDFFFSKSTVHNLKSYIWFLRFTVKI